MTVRTCQIAETSESHQATLWVPAYKIVRACTKLESGLDALVEQCRFGRHEAVDDAKLLRIWVPSKVMDGAFLVCAVLLDEKTYEDGRTEDDATVEIACCTQ